MQISACACTGGHTGTQAHTKARARAHTHVKVAYYTEQIDKSQHLCQNLEQWLGAHSQQCEPKFGVLGQETPIVRAVHQTYRNDPPSTQPASARSWGLGVD